MLKAVCAAIGFSLVVSAPAKALCIYHRIDNVKTTLEQEFHDSDWVVRAHIVSADYHWEDEGDSWTLYRLRVVKSFKGHLSKHFKFFTMRDSGGFYLDSSGAVPDVDHDYLLFLTPTAFPRNLPPAARGALDVNYNCGQSKPWQKVSPGDLARLTSMSASR